MDRTERGLAALADILDRMREGLTDAQFDRFMGQLKTELAPLVTAHMTTDNARLATENVRLQAALEGIGSHNAAHGCCYWTSERVRDALAPPGQPAAGGA